jgi:hypothetical protein
MARCHSWPLPTYPVLPHTSIPVLTADEQQMFHFFLSKPSSRCYALHTFPSLFLLDVSVHFYICPYDRSIAKTSFPPFLITFCILHTTYARPFTHLSSHLNVSPPPFPTSSNHTLQFGKPPFPHPSVFVRSFSPKAKSRCQPLYYRYKPSI